MFLTTAVLGIVLAHCQTITQLDNDHYFTQFQDGTNETISYAQTNTNVNSCLTLINRYQPVLNEIDQGQDVTQAQCQNAIQSVQTIKPSLGAATQSLNGM